MKTLLIETATEKACICLIDGTKIIFIPLDGGPHLSKILALKTSNLLKENDFYPDQIIVGKGPGSYTGTRVGLALAKSLSYGWDIPLFGFCSLNAFVPKEAPITSAILVDARAGGVYILMNGASDAILTSQENLKKHLDGVTHLYSPHPELIKKRLKKPCQEAHITNLLDLKPSPLIR